MKKTVQVIKLGLVFVILLLVVLIFSVKNVHAQQVQRAFTVVPPSIENAVNPGEYREGTMKIINEIGDPLTFDATVVDFVVDDTLGTPTFIPLNILSNKYSAASWIGVSPSTFTLKPHAKQDINFYIQVPTDARPGGHYAAVVFKPRNGIGIAGNAALVNTQVGSLISVDVNGPITEKASITKFFTDLLQEYGPIKISTQIKNYGDLHIKPLGSIVLTDMLGRKEVQKLPEYNIFPEAARDYENIMGNRLMFGRYEGKLLAAYGKNSDKFLLATVVFWVFPWKIVLVIILIIIAVILLAKYYRKKGAKHQPQPEDETAN